MSTASPAFTAPCALHVTALRTTGVAVRSVAHRRVAHPARRGAARMSLSEPAPAPASKSEPAPKTDPKFDGEYMSVVVDENIADFCSIDPKTGKRIELTVREKEALFLDAAQAYFHGESILSNAEFDALKEELTWQGSEVVTLDRDEMQFLDAARAYEKGEQLMSDEEFDKLKTKLQNQGSSVAIRRGPRCSIERKITFSDVIPDKRRTFVLYLPAGVIIALSWLSFSYELTPLHNVDPVISLVLGTPIIYFLSNILTKLVVPDPTILVGDCPSCGKRTHILFGNVLNVEGHKDSADVSCSKCKAKLRVERDTNRMILVAEGKK